MMKKQFYFLFLIGIIVSCIPQEPGYTIKGTITTSDIDDSKMVYLKDIDLNVIDSTQINNNSFEFTGTQDSAIFVMINVPTRPGKRSKIGSFFLENSKLSVYVGENVVVKGSALNQKYNAYKDGIDSIRNSIKTKSYTAYQEMTTKLHDFTVPLIKNNCDNAFGLQLLIWNKNFLKVDELETILTLIPAYMETNLTILEIKEKLKVLKQTAIGQPFLDLNMKDLDGKDTKLSNYVGKGNYVLVDFGASFYAACRNQVPLLKELYSLYHEKGFEIVTVSFDSQKEFWVKAVKKLKMTWPQMSDLKGWKSIGATKYNIRELPYSILFDREGKIVAKGLRGEALKVKIEQIFNK